MTALRAWLIDQSQQAREHIGDNDGQWHRGYRHAIDATLTWLGEQAEARGMAGDGLALREALAEVGRFAKAHHGDQDPNVWLHALVIDIQDMVERALRDHPPTVAPDTLTYYLMTHCECHGTSPCPTTVAPDTLDAAALGRRLLATGYQDFHVVEFSRTGYGLQHPIECRPDLIGCRFNRWLSERRKPSRVPGRYRMDWSTSTPTFTEVS